MKNRYPFPVRSRGSVVVTANNLSNAIDRVLELHPDKFVKTKFAKNVEQYLIRLNEKECVKVSRHNGYSSGSLLSDEDRLEELTPNIKTKLKHKLFMDLISARARALKDSANNKGKSIYVNVKPDGECRLESYSDESTFAAFKGGIEVAVPVAPPLVRKILNSKHKLTNKKMKLPDEIDLPQGVELPEEPKKLSKKEPKKSAKIIPLPVEEELEEEQELEPAPRASKKKASSRASKKAPKKAKAKELKISKLAKKAKIEPIEPAELAPAQSQKGKRARAHPVKVKRSVKTRTERRPKAKPNASEVENAKRQLALWAKERAEALKLSPKKAVAKKLAKKTAKKKK